MEKSSSKGAPFRNPLHRRIARICAEEPLGAYAIARELAVHSKDVSSPLATMSKAGLLIETPGGDGPEKLYQLEPDLLTALVEMEAWEPGLLVENQRLLLVDADDPNLVPRVLRPREIAGTLAWSARITGSGGVYLLAFASDTESLAIDSVIQRLTREGATAALAVVDDVLSALAFERRGMLMRSRAREDAERKS